MAQRSRRTPPGGASPARRRRWPAVALAGVLVGAAATALLAGRDGAPGAFERTGSVELTGRDVTVDPAAAPVAYRIVYRVEVATADGPAVTTEVVAVERPFRSHVTVLEGEPPGNDAVQERVSDLLLLAARSGAGDWTALRLAPAIASGDLRLDRAVGAAVDRGLLDAREVRQVAGLACRVFRAGGPLVAGIIEPVVEPGDHADVCLDERGLLLEELWYLDGAVARHRVAVEVEVGDVDLAAPPELTFLEPARRGGFAQELEPGDPGPYDSAWTPRNLPPGFRHLGRWVVLLPAVDSPLRDPMVEEASGAVVVADVWRRGPDVLIVDQGGRADGQPLLPPHPHGYRVSLGALGEAELVVDGRASEVRFVDDLGRSVRLLGTLEPSVLVELAGGLRLVAPGAEGETDG